MTDLCISYIHVFVFFAIQMCAFALFLSVDPSLGRVDLSLLPDQTLVEMLFEGFDDDTKKANQDSDGMYLDVCEWSCIKCDNDARVIEINIDGGMANGSLELCYVPPKMKVFRITSWYKRHLTGSVDLTQLPDGMQKLCCSSTELKGEIDLEHLPKGMVNLSLENNQLTGEIILTHLPDGMQRLLLNNNQFTREIDLTRLPAGMKFLSLENNQFTGQIDLTHLPDGMFKLFLNNNQLSGEVDLAHLPGGMCRLYLQNNEFSGEIDLTHIPDGMNVVSLENNQLSGALVISLPQRMRIVDLRGNQFNAIAMVDSKTNATIELRGSGVTSVVDENGREQNMKRFLQ